jgi:phage-related minor tail protein
MSDAVVGFANQTGMSMEEARKALVGIAVDPKKGIDELAKTFGAFDAATRQAVEELARADDKTGAFQVMMDAIKDKTKAAAENMSVAEKAARGLVNALAVSQNPAGLEGQLEAQRQRVVSAMDTPTGGLGGGEDARAAAVEREAKAYEDLNAQLQKKDALTAKAQVDKLSTDADNAVKVDHYRNQCD